jgi:uncharacterized RDD family membrane protein YckC
MDQLTIETPEQTTLEYPLAGIGSRFLALAIDTLIQLAGLLALLLLAAGWARLGGPRWRPATVWGEAAAVLAVAGIYYGYFAAFESLWNGQTPGKRRMNLRVIQDSGRPVNAMQAIARNVVRLVDQVPAFYCFGVASALLNRRNKRLGDFAAGTVVVQEQRLGTMTPDWLLAEDSGTSTYPVAALADTEVQLMETFFRRRGELEADLRARTASLVAGRIAKRLGVAPSRPRGNEEFLETVYQETRRAGGFRR